MIVGIGTDVVMLSRMQSLYDKWGERIAQRILGPQEFAVFAERRSRGVAGVSRAVSYLAKRFAAKEAVGKALGCGLSHPMSLQSLEVLNDELGAPRAYARKDLARVVEERGLVVHVSLTDEIDYAQAFVIVEKA